MMFHYTEGALSKYKLFQRYRYVCGFIIALVQIKQQNCLAYITSFKYAKYKPQKDYSQIKN